MLLVEGPTHVHKGKRLSHDDACRIYIAVMSGPLPQTVIVDLRWVRDATTSGFARLVLLRRELLARGRDLRLTGLRDRAERLYEINRLGAVLPRD